jgi:hypothetical protein
VDDYRYVAGTNSKCRRIYNQFLQLKQSEQDEADRGTLESTPAGAQVPEPTSWHRSTTGKIIVEYISRAEMWLAESTGSFARNDTICNMSARHGSLEVLQRARKNGSQAPALVWQQMVIWKCFSGPVKTVVVGIQESAIMLQSMAIRKLFLSGLVAIGIEARAIVLQEIAIRKCLSGFV